MSSHNKIARDKLGVSVRTLTDRIMRAYNRASEDDKLEGKRWYPELRDVAIQIAVENGISLERSAAVISHLSPRIHFSRNIVAARQLIATGTVPSGVMRDPADRARRAMAAEDPMSTFGPTAHKTRSFARNILGDNNAVTVDVWALRVAGVTEQQLGLVGVYDTVAHAYRLAAKRVGIEPAEMQAITWCVVRGRAD